MTRGSIKGPFPPVIPISAPCPHCGGGGGRTEEGSGPGGLIHMMNDIGDRAHGDYRDSYRRAPYMIPHLAEMGIMRISGTIEDWSYDLGFCLACWTPRPGSKLQRLLDAKRWIEQKRLEAKTLEQDNERNANWG